MIWLQSFADSNSTDYSTLSHIGLNSSVNEPNEFELQSTELKLTISPKIPNLRGFHENLI